MPPPSTYWCHLCGSRAGSWDAAPRCPSCAEGFLEHLSGGDPDIASFLLLSRFPAGSRLDYYRSGLSRRRMDAFRRRFHGRPGAYPHIGRSGGPPSHLELVEFLSFLSATSRSRLLIDEARREMEDSMFPAWLSQRGFFHDDDDDDDDDDDFGRFRSRRFMDAREVLLDSGLETIIQHIGARDSGAHGSNAASKISVDAMPLRKFSRQNSEADDVHCAICKEPYEVDEEVREMPCKHVYHSGCILPWLAKNRSCPICRHEMPAEGEKPRAAQSVPEQSNQPPPVREEVVNDGGEFGLAAVVRDVGFGIRVRSVTLWGVGGGRRDNLPGNSVEPMDPTSEGGSHTSNSSTLPPEITANHPTSQNDVSEVVPQPTVTSIVEPNNVPQPAMTSIVEPNNEPNLSTPVMADNSESSGSSYPCKLSRRMPWGSRVRKWLVQRTCSPISYMSSVGSWSAASLHHCKGRRW